MLASTPNRSSDINHELLTFMAHVYRADSRKWNLHFRREALWFGLYQTSPHHIEMSRWKPCWWVRWRCRLQHRESPDETSQKGDTHAHSFTHSLSLMWLILNGSSWRGSPNMYVDNTLAFTSTNIGSFKLSRFFHQPVYLFHKNVWYEETLFNLSTKLFCLLQLQCGRIPKWKKKTNHWKKSHFS